MGWPVGKFIILSFMVGTSKNKIIGFQGKEICAMSGLPIQNKNFDLNPELIVTNIVSTQVTYKSDHISLLMIQQCQVQFSDIIYICKYILYML